MASVAANSNIRMPIVDNQAFQINCPTRYIYFDPDGYTEEVAGCDKDPVKVAFEEKDRLFKKKCSDHEVGSPDFMDCYLPQMNKVISEHVKDCWEQFGSGYMKVFSTYNTERQCLICSVIDFSPELKNLGGEENCFTLGEGDEDFSETCLDEFMRTHKPAGHDISYYQYCMDAADGLSSPYYDYDLEKSYAVVFTAINEHNVQSRMSDLWGYLEEHHDPQWDWMLGKPDGGDQDIRFVNLLNYLEQEEVVAYCDTIENNA